MTDDTHPTEGEVLKTMKTSQVLSLPLRVAQVGIAQEYLVENAPLGPNCTLPEGNGLIFLLADQKHGVVRCLSVSPATCHHGT